MLETNVHFPTDSNLLYDAIRKTIKLTAKLCKKYQIVGWRQINYNIKKIKSIVRLINKIKKSNPRKQEKVLAKEQQLKKAYNKLIKRSEAFIEKSKISIEILKNKFLIKDFDEIEHFIFYAKLLIGQIKIRVFQGEKIPHNEKIFSVFQTHTEWICKGKAKAPFELGKRVSIVEDQYKCIKEAADQAYPSLPGPVKDWALDASAKEATKCADKAMNRSVDSCFDSRESLGSRAILYIKSWV